MIEKEKVTEEGWATETLSVAVYNKMYIQGQSEGLYVCTEQVTVLEDTMNVCSGR